MILRGKLKEIKDKVKVFLFTYNLKALEVTQLVFCNFTFVPTKEATLFSAEINKNSNDKIIVAASDNVDPPGITEGSASMYSIAEQKIKASVSTLANGNIELTNGNNLFTISNDGEISISNEKSNIMISNDGKIDLKNEKGELILATDGGLTHIVNGKSNVFNADTSINFANGAKITATGDVVTKLGNSLDTHPHTGNLGAPTSPPIPGGAGGTPIVDISNGSGASGADADKLISDYNSHKHEAGTLVSPAGITGGPVTGLTGIKQ